MKRMLLHPQMDQHLKRKGMLFCVKCDGEFRRASGERAEMEQLVEQKGEESCLFLHGSRRQAERHCCVTQLCVLNKPRLHETPWLQVVSEQKNVSS